MASFRFTSTKQLFASAAALSTSRKNSFYEKDDSKSIKKARRKRSYPDKRISSPKKEVYQNYEFDGTPTPKDLATKKLLLKRVKEIVQGYMKTHEIAGLSVAVSVSGNLKVMLGAGLQDQNLQIPCEPETVASISTISKTVLSYLLMKLQLNGQVDFSKDMGTYMPSFPKLRVAIPLHCEVKRKDAEEQNAWQPLFTTKYLPKREYEYNSIKEHRLLMNLPLVKFVQTEDQFSIPIFHYLLETSGLKPYHLYSERNTQRSFGNLQSVVNKITSFPLRFKPGQLQADENVSFEVLALLVQTITGERYQDYVSKELLRLGLENTAFLAPDDLFLHKNRGSQRPTTEEKNGKVALNATFVDYSTKLGSEGLCSNVWDLNKLFTFLYKCYKHGSCPELRRLPISTNEVDEMLASPHEVLTKTHDKGVIHRRKGKGIMVDTIRQLKLGRKVECFYQEGRGAEATSIGMVTHVWNGDEVEAAVFAPVESDDHDDDEQRRLMTEDLEEANPDALYVEEEEESCVGVARTEECDACSNDDRSLLPLVKVELLGGCDEDDEDDETAATATETVVRAADYEGVSPLQQFGLCHGASDDEQFVTVSIIAHERDRNVYDLARDITNAAATIYGFYNLL